MHRLIFSLICLAILFLGNENLEQHDSRMTFITGNIATTIHINSVQVRFAEFRKAKTKRRAQKLFQETSC